jgi:hypothetical protein
VDCRLKFRPAPYPGGDHFSFFAELFWRWIRLAGMWSTRLFYRQRASIAVTDPDHPLRRGPGFRAPSHFRGKSHPGATIFLLRIEGASARFFSSFSAMASLAPTNAHLNCGLAPCSIRFGCPFRANKIRGFRGQANSFGWGSSGRSRLGPRQALRHCDFWQRALASSMASHNTTTSNASGLPLR